MRLIALILSLLPALGSADEVAQVRYADLDGEVTLEASPGLGADTPFPLASVGKTMTAVAVLRVLAREGIALDAPAAAHLPPDVTAMLALDGITIRHLLAMRSGLVDYYDADFDARTRRAPEAATARTAIAHIADEPLMFDPGREDDYSNTNYVLLGLLLEHITDAPYHRVMEAEVFASTGMRNAVVFGGPLPDALPPVDARTRAAYTRPGLGDGGVIASARDLARFYAALDEGALLPEPMLDALLHDPDGDGYGLGIEVGDWPIVGHSGGDVGFSSDVRMDLESGDLALILIATEDADTDWAYEQLAFD